MFLEAEEGDTGEAVEETEVEEGQRQGQGDKQGLMRLMEVKFTVSLWLGTRKRVQPNLSCFMIASIIWTLRVDNGSFTYCCQLQLWSAEC